jgi:Carboxypeptidase regulatory-like domain/TonB-dependent Receptor Plug Domain
VQVNNVRRLCSRAIAGALVSAVIMLAAPATWAQGAGTATIRGTVSDSSGGILPGANVTITNSATKEARTSVTSDRGGFTFASLFPGNYEIKAELQGFKTYEAKNIILSPNDTRGLDVQLEVGSLTEVVSVTSPVEIIQTETGAREGVIRADQIENLSVLGRSSLELLRILPGVVAPDNTAFESVSFGGGANNTQGYTVNGIRSSGNTVSLDGSALIDIGSNSGVIVTLNNDMVQEVKVQSSNFEAEYGAAGMSVSAVTKSGSSQFHGTVYGYNRDSKFAANDRSNSIAGVDKPKSKFNYFGGNAGGPILLPGTSFNKDRNRAFFFVGFEVQRQQVDQGARFGVVPTLKQRNGDFSEFLTSNGQNLGQPVGQLVIPQGFPGAGTPIANNNLAPYITPVGRVLTNLYPVPNYVSSNNQFNYVFSQLEPTNRVDFKARFDYTISNSTKAYVRIAREKEEVEGARGVWWGASEVALPSPNLGTNVGRSVSGNVVSVLSPTMTNEVLVSWSRLTLDNTYKDPTKMSLAGNGISLPGPFGNGSPYIPGVVPNWGGGVSNMWSAANDMYAHNDELTFANKLTKIAGAHNLKFGGSLSRLQKQQNFQNNEEMYLVFAGPGWSPGSSGNAVGDILTGRPTQLAGAGSAPPNGEFRFWNFDAFAQDSWRVRQNLTLQFGVRAGKWTNNAELNGLGAYFDPAAYNPNQGEFLDPGTYRVLNGYCYVSTGCADDGVLENRPLFAMPRINAAWDIDGEGNNVVRGGYGLFYNRNMGNVEYDNALRLPPAAYNINADVFNTPDPDGTGVGLTYSTLDDIRLADRIGAVPLTSLTNDSWTFPKTHSFSVSYARRIFFNQVLEAAYVGTRGRDLVSRVNGNPVPEGALLQGRVGNADLSVPVNRVALDAAAINLYRPYQSFPSLNYYDFEGVSNYNSMQVTLSRQTGKRLQYLATYTLGRTKGTLGDEYRNRDPFNPARTYGIRQEDRTHVFNLSWNAFLPDAIKESGNPIAKGVLNGWQLSGISTVASGSPIWLGFAGPAGSGGISQAYYGTGDVQLLTENGSIGNGLAPVYTCDPRLDGKKVGEKIFDINCIGFPAFGEIGEVLPPYDLRTPTRQNHDITLFKNFAIRGDQKIQFRVGVFNIFNQAFATTAVTRSDLDLTLETVCNRTVDNVPNGVGGTNNGVCDPTGGFSFTQNTRSNFGKINIMRGRRIIEFALKYYF